MEYAVYNVFSVSCNWQAPEQCLENEFTRSSNIWLVHSSYIVVARSYNWYVIVIHNVFIIYMYKSSNNFDTMCISSNALSLFITWLWLFGAKLLCSGWRNWYRVWGHGCDTTDSQTSCASVVVTFGSLWGHIHDRKRGNNFYSIMVPQN